MLRGSNDATMDTSLIKTLLPVAILAITGLIALVKVKAKSDQTAQDMVGVLKDLDRLEKEAHHTTRLLAQVSQLEKNVTQLWKANDDLLVKLERHRDRLDERFIMLREKVNGKH